VGGVHVGIVVSKKVGKAVVRNRVRRRLREALRAVLLKAETKRKEVLAFELVIIARPEAAEADYWQLRGALEHALAQRSGFMTLNLFQRVVLAPIHLYRRVLSPLKPYPSCRFSPTCSRYAVDAIGMHGVLRGSYLAVKRI
jgi:ribonuclease P protein component